MVNHASLFSQMLSLVDRHGFEQEVRRLGAERHAKGFSCWSQFVAMMFCQLAQAKSLREIIDGLACCEGKLRHLGLSEGPRRSTLSYANAHRPWQLYEALFYRVLPLAQSLAPAKRFRFKNKLFSLDATVIELCLSLFDWAKFRQTKGAIKLHLLLDHDGYLPVFAHISEGASPEIAVARELDFPKGSIVVIDRGFIDYKLFARWSDQGVYFVTRLKENADFGAYEIRAQFQSGTVRRDEVGMLNMFTAGAWWRREMRLVTIWDQQHQRELKLLTNQLHLAASTIAAIYKERWQIEIFFKTLKQNLKIKTFVGSTPNAVRIQIWTALIAMLLIKILQLRSSFAWALSNLVALLRWNLFTYRNLWEWINRPFDTPPESPPDQPELFDLDSIAAPS
jgi:Domain of unknown function (DUF4372)/Transposase DDE domain